MGVGFTYSAQEVGSRLTRSLAKTDESKGREKRSVETWTPENTEEDRFRRMLTIVNLHDLTSVRIQGFIIFFKEESRVQNATVQLSLR